MEKKFKKVVKSPNVCVCCGCKQFSLLMYECDALGGNICSDCNAVIEGYREQLKGKTIKEVKASVNHIKELCRQLSEKICNEYQNECRYLEANWEKADFIHHVEWISTINSIDNWMNQVRNLAQLDLSEEKLKELLSYSNTLYRIADTIETIDELEGFEGHSWEKIEYAVSNLGKYNDYLFSRYSEEAENYFELEREEWLKANQNMFVQA